MEERQIHYGPAFQGVKRIWVGTDEVLGRVRLPDAVGDASAYSVHPALVDACFQLCAALIGEERTTPPCPSEIDRAPDAPPRLARGVGEGDPLHRRAWSGR